MSARGWHGFARDEEVCLSVPGATEVCSCGDLWAIRTRKLLIPLTPRAWLELCWLVDLKTAR